MEEPQTQGVTIVVVPFPAQGHLNQLLHFSLHLSARGLPVHFASSPTHTRQARARIHGWDPYSLRNIHFHQLPLPPFATPQSDPDSANKFPSHLIPSFHAAMQLKSPISSLFRSLSLACARLVVVHDPLMAFACSEADALPNAETYRFCCVSASYQLSKFPDVLHNQLNDTLSEEVRNVVLTPLDNCFTKEFRDFINKYKLHLSTEVGILCNTCWPIDAEFIDLIPHLPRFRGKKLFSIGPINPILVQRDHNKEKRHECLEWLDKQPRGSVLYVAFGSTTSIADEQIKQLAIGLQFSRQRFIWVLRDADRGDIDAYDGGNEQRELPAEFEEEVRGVGMVVRGWAPQLEILAHNSTGGFLSHCGWNSCMESLSLGVPIIAWPMHSDQPRNAILVTEYLKVGVRVREWGPHDKVVSAEEVEKSIRRLMAEEEGDAIRKRAETLGEEIRASVDENGSSRSDLDSFVAYITRK